MFLLHKTNTQLLQDVSEQMNHAIKGHLNISDTLQLYLKHTSNHPFTFKWGNAKMIFNLQRCLHNITVRLGGVELNSVQNEAVAVPAHEKKPDSLFS